MRVLTVRGIDGELDRVLRSEASNRKMSLNALVLELVRQGLGVVDVERRRHRELDHLAGTWTDAEVTEFTRSTTWFEQVDHALWQ